MTTFNEFVDEMMQDPAFKKEYDALEPEFTIIQAMIDARRDMGLTREKLAALAGISQKDIGKLEAGDGDVSLRTLQKLAAALGKQVRVEFV